MNIIKEIPDIPRQIIDSVNKEQLVIFIGAGVSRLINCSGWEHLALKLIDEFVNLSGAPLIRYQEIEQIREIKDHRKIITIMKYLYETKNKINDFYNILKNALKDNEEDLNEKNIYNDIYKFHGICLTTNIDRHFHKCYSELNILYDINNFDISNISQNKLYKIHGTIEQFDTIVFTLEDYFRVYSNPKFINFLNDIFTKYTILFIGYGLSEFELIEYLFSNGKIKTPDEKLEAKRYILSPYFEYQQTFLEYDQEYFKYMGIEILPYKIDDIGYYQLNNILKDWNKKINISSNAKLELKEKIEDLIENYGKL